MTQLDFDQALAAKTAGLARVAATHADFVRRMRAVAVTLSQVQGEVHIDDLRQAAERHGWRPAHPNAWGAIFRGPGWQRLGTRPSAWPSNHGHVSPVWRWVGA